MDPATMYLIGSFGSKLASALFGTSAAQKEAQRRRREQLAALRPLDALLGQYNFGPSATEADMLQTTTSRTLSDLAHRGVLQSSITAPTVAAAVAPIEERRQARRQGLMERLAAAKQAIFADNPIPGYGDAFAGLLGEAGSLFANEYGRRRRANDIEDFLAQLGLGQGGASDRQDVSSVIPEQPTYPDINYRQVGP